MQRFAAKVLIGAIFAMLVLVAVPAPAAAHDPGCTFATHAGPVKLHVNCDEKNNDSSSGCVYSVNAGPVREDVLC